MYGRRGEKRSIYSERERKEDRGVIIMYVGGGREGEGGRGSRQVVRAL